MARNKEALTIRRMNFLRAAGVALGLCLGVVMGAVQAQDWAGMATVSTTMGAKTGRLCVGEGFTTDARLGCPAYAPELVGGGISVSGIVTATYLEGDGSRLRNISATSALPGFSCPAGFALVLGQGQTMGCIQTSNNAALNCLPAAQACFSSSGGRLPSFAEHYAAIQAGVFVHPGVDEWTGEAGYNGSNRTCGISTAAGEPSSGVHNGATRAYRCFIPAVAIVSGTGGGNALADRISSSNSHAVVLATPAGTVSITTGNVAGTSYFDTMGRWVGPGVSITTMNGISSTNGYFTHNGYFGRSLGVGTNTPSAMLDVAGHAILSAATSRTLSFGSVGVGTPGPGSSGMKLQLYGNSANVMENTDYALGVETNYMWFNSGVNGFKWYTNAGQQMMLHNGNLGISDTNPSTRLSVMSSQSGNEGASANLIAKFAFTGNGIGSSGRTLQMGAVSSGTLYLQSSQYNDWATHTSLSLNPTAGNVGIGTYSPTTRLDVAGNISASGAIQVGTSALTCTAGIPGAIRYNSGSLEYCDGATWTVLGGGGGGGGPQDRIVSGSFAMIANSSTAVVSLSTGSTTWGYFANAMSYLPRINSERVSSSLISSTHIQLSSATDVLACGQSLTGTMRYTSGSVQVCDGDEWNNVGVGVPTGSIMAFSSAACPPGWLEYTPARGRFLRGIDTLAAGIDPSGTRSPGSLQGDTLGSHTHGYDLSKARDASSSPPHVRFGYATDGQNNYNNVTGAIRSAGNDETRPKNVAVYVLPIHRSRQQRWHGWWCDAPCKPDRC